MWQNFWVDSFLSKRSSHGSMVAGLSPNEPEFLFCCHPLESLWHGGHLARTAPLQWKYPTFHRGHHWAFLTRESMMLKGLIDFCIRKMWLTSGYDPDSELWFRWSCCGCRCPWERLVLWKVCHPEIKWAASGRPRLTFRCAGWEASLPSSLV